MHGRHRTPNTATAPSALSRTRWSLLLLLSVAQLMVILDISAVNVALPDLATDLNIAHSDIGWTITSYSLIFGSLLLFGGRAADLLGRRRVFLTGLAVFTVSSLATALAVDATTLFAARAGQGLGAAMLSPAALSIITTTFQGPERAKALGVWGAVGGAGAAIGVLLGGVLTELVDWRAIFFINLPVGLGARRRRRCTSCPPTRRGRSGAASICAARCWPPPASARSSTPSLRPQSSGWTSTQTLGVGAAGTRRARRLRRTRTAHRTPAPARPAPRRPRRRRRLRDDARRLRRAVRLLPAVLAVPAERARHRRA